jgi:hypothetical protein
MADNIVFVIDDDGCCSGDMKVIMLIIDDINWSIDDDNGDDYIDDYIDDINYDYIDHIIDDSHTGVNVIMIMVIVMMIILMMIILMIVIML